MKKIILTLILSLWGLGGFSQVLITPDNQGIGTSLPYSTSKLTLDGKDLTNEVLSLRSDAYPFINIYSPIANLSFANRAAYLGLSTDGFTNFFDIGTHSNTGLGLGLLANGNKRFFIHPNGYVGVGYNPVNPQAALNLFVTDTQTEALRLTSSTNEINPLGPYMTFYKDNTRRASIASSNKLSGPGHSLDIISDDELALKTYSNSTLHTLFHGLPNGNVGIPYATNSYNFNVGGTVNFNSKIYVKGFIGNFGDVLRSGGPDGEPFWSVDGAPFVSAESPTTTYPHSIENYINFSNEKFDSEGLLNGGTLTIRQNGIYQVYIEIPLFTPNSNKFGFIFRIYKNNDTTPIHEEAVSNTIYGFVNGEGTLVHGAVSRYKFVYQDLWNLLRDDTLHVKIYHVDAYQNLNFKAKINVAILHRKF